MDQLIIRTGGHPDSADDLMHLQNAFQQAIDTLFQMMLRTPEKAYRLYGCQVFANVDGDRLQTTEGGFFFQREFFKVEAHDIPVPDGTNPTDYGWKIEQTYRPGNPVTYADGTQHSPHSIRQMKLTYVAAEMDVGETQVQNFNLNDLVPKAKWSGTSLSFEYADGTQSTATDLKGEKGETGPQGIQGIQGPKGEKGDQVLPEGVVSYRSELPGRINTGDIRFIGVGMNVNGRFIQGYLLGLDGIFPA